MATTRSELTSAWLLVAASDKEFIVENPSTYNVDITFQDSAPAVDAPHHVLRSGEALLRMGVAGNVYVRNTSANQDEAYVVVSLSA